MEFTKKKILILGGSKGIGRAVAEKLLDEGAQVISISRSKSKLKSRSFRLKQITADLSVPLSQLKVFREFNGKCFDGVFYNYCESSIVDFRSVSANEFSRVFRSNIQNFFFNTQLLMSKMKKNSSFVLTSSISAKQMNANSALYSSSKAWQISLLANLAVELSVEKLRFNAVSPGAIASGLLVHSSEAQMHQHIHGLNELRSRIPMKRLGSAEEIANVVLFLLSGRSSYINGQNIIVDGGLTLT